MHLIAALPTSMLVVDVERGTTAPARGVADRPTCAAADARQAWCGTRQSGVYRSDDGGLAWTFAGLRDLHVTAVAVGPRGVVWAGTEPSQLWRSDDAGGTWQRMEAMEALPSSSDWSFPPKPDTHHVRWIACHPSDPERLWVAIEAGALVGTADGGRSWRDRVAGGPYDTHELAIHAMLPDTLRSAAGDGYYESHDGGSTWDRPRIGLDVDYLRSVAVAPDRHDIVLLSAASSPRSAYVAGVADGRIYRRTGDAAWERVTRGWPERPSTIAPLLAPGTTGCETWAADERGVHRSDDGGARWEQVVAWPATPNHLRALAVIPEHP